MSAEKIVFREIKDLISAEYNPRKMSTKDYEDLKSSLLRFGFVDPVIVNKHPERMDIIVGGHQRLLVWKDLGYEHVPTVEVNLDPAKEKELNIRLNKNTAGWDPEKLREYYDIDSLMEYGFTEDELSELEGFEEEFSDESEPAAGNIEDDEMPEATEPTVQPGQIWILGDHRLMCGDCTSNENVEKLMDNDEVEIVMADPPYGIDIVKSNQEGGGGPTRFGTDGSSNIVPASKYREIIGDKTTDTAKCLFDVLCNMGIFRNYVFWGGNYFTEFLPPSRCWIVWDKQMTGNFSQAEMAWTSYKKGGIRIFKHIWNGLSREGARNEELKSRVHPTQKPVGLFCEILDYLKVSGVVYDPFMGSGTTMIACEKTNRKCYGMEIDPKYCDVIIQRWEKFTGRKASLSCE